MDPNPQSPTSRRSRCRCCCFPVAWQWIRTAGEKTRPETSRPRRWWRSAVEAMMKAREWSEIAAGPKWKTFIRRINRRNGSGDSWKRFGYDPLSYSLNFEASPDRDFGYSTRFVAAQIPGKDLMEAVAEVR